MRNLRFLSFLLALPLAACGGDGDGDDDAVGPDASTEPDADTTPAACAELLAPQGTIAVPGEFTGTIVGEGADITVADEACAEQGSWYEPVGEDAVVHLTGLTAGTEYGLVLRANDDVSFYLVTGCSGGSPGAGECAVFDDTGYIGDGEQHLFTAAGTEAWVVVDNAEIPAPSNGNFTLSVVVPECETEAECTAVDAPLCVGYACVECENNFDCDGATEPVCDETNTCAAGPTACTGDDAGDTTGNGDDGPAVARTLVAPTAGVPTVQAAAVCGTPATEGDWYKVTLAAGDFGIQLDWVDAAADLDVYLIDSEGEVVEAANSSSARPEAVTATVDTAGDYYLYVLQYAPTTAAATPYTLTLRVPECETSFDCDVVAAPFCNAAGGCGAGPASCTGDDAGDATTGDDGPAGARALTSGVATEAAVCNTPAGEADWYQVTAVAGEGITVDLAWTGTADLDVTVMDSAGTIYGVSYYVNPEHVVTTYLPAGTYLIQVVMFGDPVAAAQPYTITATTTADQTCTSSADCAAAYSTQVYRGLCDGGDGACKFITATGGANGAACDTNADCTSGRCSYISFDADSQDSVCVPTCTQDADCAAVPNTKCLVGANLQTRWCVPVCASDLECGANIGSATLDTDQPWDYLTCTEATGVCSLP